MLSSLIYVNDLAEVILLKQSTGSVLQLRLKMGEC